MAFNIGQLRSSTMNSYTNPLTYSVSTITTPSTLSGAVMYKDMRVQLTGSSSVLQSTSSYYIRFSIKEMTEYSQMVKVYLKYSGAQEDNTQDLKTVTIERGADEVFRTYDFIFTPNGTYDQIIFELMREPFDNEIRNDDDTYGRVITLKIDSLVSINNVITSLPTTVIKKLGIQGPQGMLFCMNGEELRIGRTGIYELAFEYDVDFLGFIIDALPNKNSFILDYQY